MHDADDAAHSGGTVEQEGGRGRPAASRRRACGVPATPERPSPSLTWLFSTFPGSSAWCRRAAWQLVVPSTRLETALSRSAEQLLAAHHTFADRGLHPYRTIACPAASSSTVRAT